MRDFLRGVSQAAGRNTPAFGGPETPAPVPTDAEVHEHVERARLAREVAAELESTSTYVETATDIVDGDLSDVIAAVLTVLGRRGMLKDQ